MDLSELQIFLHLAETLHFGRTSEACNLSPSAVSRTILRLEQEAGARLFLRDNKSVELTMEGELFREFARETLMHWDRYHERLASQAGELTGEVKLFSTVTACYSILPPLLSSFHDTFPKIHLKLQTGDASQALPQVLDALADISVAPLPNNPP
ncbi:MAG TPA: LysR family transcriptional regulator, partial [Armatimonadota bacterium]|nr:LysR family transcriptional regulator [Armatimonadota bacterium]